MLIYPCWDYHFKLSKLSRLSRCVDMPLSRLSRLWRMPRICKLSRNVDEPLSRTWSSLSKLSRHIWFVYITLSRLLVEIVKTWSTCWNDLCWELQFWLLWLDQLHLRPVETLDCGYTSDSLNVKICWDFWLRLLTRLLRCSVWNFQDWWYLLTLFSTVSRPNCYRFQTFLTFFESVSVSIKCLQWWNGNPL